MLTRRDILQQAGATAVLAATAPWWLVRRAHAARREKLTVWMPVALAPQVDKLLEDARVEFDKAAQDALYQQVCEITKDELPNLYLWQSVRFHVVSNKAQNVIVIPAAGGGSYYDAAELWTVTP